MFGGLCLWPIIRDFRLMRELSCLLFWTRPCLEQQTYRNTNGNAITVLRLVLTQPGRRLDRQRLIVENDDQMSMCVLRHSSELQEALSRL